MALRLFLDGDWSSWEPWSTCDKDCGGGIERRYRVCEDFSDTGTYCEGRNSQEKACNTAGCAIGKELVSVNHRIFKSPGVLCVDGNWGGWTCWSDCTVTCGSSGHRNRVRHCDNPAPAHGGSPCSGKPEEEKPCDGMPPCPRGVWFPVTVVTDSVITMYSLQTGNGHFGRNGVPLIRFVAVRQSVDETESATSGYQ